MNCSGPKIEERHMKLESTQTIATLIFAVFASLSTLNASFAYALATNTHNGIAYITGGVTIDERAEMMAKRKDFTLLIKVAAKSSKYVGGTDVKITDQGGSNVFECTTDGPWLLVDLPVGRYSIGVTGVGIAQSQKILISKKTTRELTMAWDIKD